MPVPPFPWRMAAPDPGDIIAVVPPGGSAKAPSIGPAVGGTAAEPDVPGRRRGADRPGRTGSSGPHRHAPRRLIIDAGPLPVDACIPGPGRSDMNVQVPRWSEASVRAVLVVFGCLVLVLAAVHAMTSGLSDVAAPLVTGVALLVLSRHT